MRYYYTCSTLNKPTKEELTNEEQHFWRITVFYGGDFPQVAMIH